MYSDVAGKQYFRWRQHGHPLRWCPAKTLHGVTTRKQSNLNYGPP